MAINKDINTACQKNLKALFPNFYFFLPRKKQRTFKRKNASFSNKVFCPTFFQKSWWVWVKPTKKDFIDRLINRS